MRHVAFALLLLLVGFASGWMARPVPVEAGPGVAATANGDTNGDGSRDISDAVYLLNWLFNAGPEPVPLDSENPRFVDSGDGTVLDTMTDLVWTKASLDTNGDGLNDFRDDLTRAEARLFVEDLEFAGHQDWRLPTTLEVATLIRSNSVLPASFPEFDFRGGTFWVLSTNSGNPCHGAQFSVDLQYGTIGLQGEEGSQFIAGVIAVRSR